MPMLKRFVEFVKSLLILALIASAVYLTYHAWSVSIGTGGDLLAYLRGEEPQLPASYTEYEEYNSLQSILMPLSAVVRSENGMYTVSSASDTAALFERTRPAFNEALTAAKAPEVIDAYAWRQLLLGSMVLYDFVGEIPLDVAATLAGGSAVPFPSVTKLVLAAADDGTVTMGYCTADDVFYRCVTAADASALYTTLLSYPADGSGFLFENGFNTTCLTTTFARTGAVLQASPVLDTTVSTEASRITGTVLEALGFNSYITKAYPESDTVRVYVEEFNTMRLSDNGKIRYYSPTADTGAKTMPEGLRKAGLLADAHEICNRAVAASLGDVSPYLIKTYTDETTGRFVVLFGIHADGIPAAVDGGYIASFEYCGQDLVTADLTLASYTLTPTEERLLPIKQAYAAVGGTGEIVPRYVGEDGRYSLGWYLVE